MRLLEQGELLKGRFRGLYHRRNWVARDGTDRRNNHPISIEEVRIAKSGAHDDSEALRFVLSYKFWWSEDVYSGQCRSLLSNKYCSLVRLS